MPQPDWLIDRANLAGRFPPRVRARELWRVAPDLLAEAQDDATLLAIRAQEDAGIDIVTDGEIRRESYSNHFATALAGVDIDNPGTALDRYSCCGGCPPRPVMSSPLLVEHDDGVETWTLNLPAERNPMSGDAMVDAIERAVDRVKRDISVRTVIVTGAGAVFSAGGDVRAMADRTGLFAGSAHDIRRGYRDGIQRIPRALYACEVPVIAAVNGAAVGGGCDLAMMCDFRIAARSAFFAESHVKLAAIAGDGGAWFLQRVIGAEHAAEMFLTGDRVDAEQALAWGLVSRVVPDDQLMTEAHVLADRIAVNAPHAVRASKKLLREARRQSLDEHLELAAAVQAIAHTSDEHAEAVHDLVRRIRPGR